MTITFVLDKNLSSADATVALASHREGVASDRAFAIARHDRVDDARDRLDQIVRDVAEIKLPPRPDALEPLRPLVDLIGQLQRRSNLDHRLAHVALERDRRSRLVESSSSARTRGPASSTGGTGIALVSVEHMHACTEKHVNV